MSIINVNEIGTQSGTDVAITTGKTVTGTASQFKITGGSSGEFLKTDGSGGLSFDAAGGGLNSMQVFTTSGSWTRPTGITKVMVNVVSAGGAGGGGRTTYNYSGAGGSAGGSAMKLLDVSSISTATITIAAAVTGGADNTGGADGGVTSWADGTNTVTCNGGIGGDTGGESDNTNPPAVGSGGDINSAGGGGNQAYYNDSTQMAQNMGPGGHSGFFGGPIGTQNQHSSDTADSPGYGHGGSGGSINSTGGKSAPGIIWVLEYK